MQNDERLPRIIGFYRRLNNRYPSEAVMLKYPDGKESLTTGLVYNTPSEEYMAMWEPTQSINLATMRQKIIDNIQTDPIFDVAENRQLASILKKTEETSMKEVFNLNVRPDLKKLHTQKSLILQRYQPVYTAYYNVTVDKNLGNFAKVCFDTGKTVMVDGARHALDFLKMEASELRKAVEPLLAPRIAADQNQLFRQLELNQYSTVYPKKDLQLPYLLLQECQTDLFAYCPMAKENKFAVLVRDLDGQVLRDGNSNLFGVYSDQIAEMEHIDRFHIPGLLESLKEIEPVAVQEYQEHVVMQKLDKVFQETGARMFVFSGQDDNTPALVSFPAEANDYLTPEELKLAEEVILRQESQEQTIQDEPELEEEQTEYGEEEEMEPDLCM